MIRAIIFDLGGVLIDWNPVYLYQKIFEDEAQMSSFLNTVCTSDWNEEQDAGRSLADATAHLLEKHPQHEAHIRAYYSRWEEMLGGAINETVNILQTLKHDGNYKLYALTNWSAETFPIALDRFNFLHWFDGIVVSGAEKMRKPSAEFYHLLLERYHLQPAEAIFIDDNLRNIIAAKNIGIDSIHYTSAQNLKTELETRHLLN